MTATTTNKILIEKHPLHWRDTLNGTALKNNEKLRVTWPDGMIQEITIHVVIRRYITTPVHDNHEAYYTFKTHGTRDAWTRLLGLTAVRI